MKRKYIINSLLMFVMWMIVDYDFTDVRYWAVFVIMCATHINCLID